MHHLMSVFCSSVLFLSSGSTLIAQHYEVTSPGGNLSITVSTDGRLTYSVDFNGSEIISSSTISMTLQSGQVLGANPKVIRTDQRDVDETITPEVAEKRMTIRDRYSELSLLFEGGWGLDARAYDDGVAYRFRTSIPKELTIENEQFEVVFTRDHNVFFPTEESFLTHSERVYEYISLRGIPARQMASMPVLVTIDSGPRIAITESDLRDYPGMYLTGTSGTTLRGTCLF